MRRRAEKEMQGIKFIDFIELAEKKSAMTEHVYFKADLSGRFLPKMGRHCPPRVNL